MRLSKVCFMITVLIAPAGIAAADELDKSWAICAAKKIPAPPGPIGAWAAHQYPGGWEHCMKIEEAYYARKAASEAQDEGKNPDLAETRAAARGLHK